MRDTRLPGILMPTVWTAITVTAALAAVALVNPEATGGPWTSAIFGATVLVVTAIVVLLALGYAKDRPRLLEPIPALVTVPITLMLGQTMRLSSTLNDLGDPTFHLRATLRWAALPLPWEANPFSQGFGTTYPWYWHLLNSIVVRAMTVLGIDPERAFVLSIGVWAFTLPLAAYLNFRWLTRSPLAVTAAVGTLALIATIDTYKSWSFVLATALIVLATKLWLGLSLGTISGPWRPFLWAAATGAGVGVLFGWYTSTALVTGLALGLLMICTGWGQSRAIDLKQRALLIVATGIGFGLAAAPFWLSARSAVSSAAGGATVALKTYDEIPYALSFTNPLWLFAVILPGLLVTTALLYTRHRLVAVALLTVAGAGLLYSATDLMLPNELFHARVSFLPSYALAIGLLWGTPVLVNAASTRLNLPALPMATIALLLIPAQVLGYNLVLSTVREGGHREWIEKTFLTQPNSAVVEIAEASDTPLLALPAPQVVASDDIDLWKLVIGSDWSVFQDRVAAVPDAKPSSRLITTCQELHQALTSDYSSPIDLAIVSPAPGGLANLTMRQVTGAFVASGDTNGEVRDLRLEFPAGALCSEEFQVTEARGFTVAKPLVR